MTNILSLPRYQNVQDISTVFVVASETDQQTYGLTWDNLVVSLAEAVTGGAAGDFQQIQYNEAGQFAASPDFKWDSGLNTLQINGSIAVAVGGVTAASFNSVVLSNAGASTDFLNGSGSYTAPIIPVGGSDSQIQFNDNSAFNGSANLTWDSTGLTVGGMTGYLNAALFNGAALTAAGATTNFLNEQGAYSVPIAAPAGANTQLQFNSSGALEGSSNLTWDGTTLNALAFNSVALTATGAATDFLNGSGAYSALPVTGPAGADTYIQFNNAGSFGASERLKWNGLTLDVGSTTQPGVLNVGNNIVMGISDAIGNVGGYFTGIGRDDAASKDFKWLNQSQVEVFAIDNLGAATATSFNGVALTAVGTATNYLSEDGTYTVPDALLPAGESTELQYNLNGVTSATIKLAWDGLKLDRGLDHFQYVLTDTNLPNTVNNYNPPGSGLANLIDFRSGNTAGNTPDGTVIVSTANAISGGSGTGLSIEVIVTGGVITDTGSVINEGTGYVGGDEITITCGGVGNPLNGSGTATFFIRYIDFSIANALRLGSAGGIVSVTGFQAPPPGVQRIITVSNIVNDRIIFLPNSAGSLAANRIIIKSNGGNNRVDFETTTAFWYDPVSQRWRQMYKGQTV